MTLIIKEFLFKEIIDRFVVNQDYSIKALNDSLDIERDTIAGFLTLGKITYIIDNKSSYINLFLYNENKNFHYKITSMDDLNVMYIDILEKIDNSYSSLIDNSNSEYKQYGE
jgi:hypothetical protein